MGHGGKGSVARPYSVSQEQFANNFDAIFGKKKAVEPVQEVVVAETTDNETNKEGVDTTSSK